VTQARLKNDVSRHFLPPPRTVPSEDGRSRVGYWNAVAVTRVKRLYRLRRRGVEGEVLRLLLFLADGWGWEHVRDTCRTGVDRATSMSLSGLGQYVRKRQPDGFAIENIRKHQHEPLVRALGDVDGLKETSEPMTRFYLGVLKDGVPLEGGSARSLMEPMLQSFVPEASPDDASFAAMMFDVIATLLDLRAERLVQRVEAAGAHDVECGRLGLRSVLRDLRRIARRAAGPDARGTSCNLLGVGGHARELGEHLAASPGRVTLAQVLGYCVGMHVALRVAFRELAASFEGLLPMLPALMGSLPTMNGTDLEA
jgi:hypothetical protein